MLSNTQARNRIDAINELISNHKGDSAGNNRYEVTPYDVLLKGFISEEYTDEYNRLMDEMAKLGEHSESPLTLPEQLSFANYFAIHPEKICGVMHTTTSGGFPVRVKGKREDVERVINETLKGAITEKAVKLYNLKFIKNTDDTIVHFSFESEEPKALVEMRIELDDDNCMMYLAETDTKFFQYRSVQVKEYSDFSNVVRINRNPVEIKQYLDNPQIKELLKDYYPKDSTQKDNPISKINLSASKENSFKYRLRSRPCGIGCQPDGFINYSEMDKRETGFYGELTYDRELTENEIYKFELIPSNTPDPQKNKEGLTDFKVEQQSASFFDFSFFDNQFGIKLYMTVLFMPDGSVNYQPYKREHHIGKGGNGYKAGFSFRTVNEKQIPYYLKKDEIQQFLKPVLEKVQSNKKRQRRIRVATATAIALALAYNYKKD